MDFNEQPLFPNSNISVCDFLSTVSKKTLVSAILQGLTVPCKFISSMFFYDSTGSKLFEKITTLPEYYQYRIEIGLIKEYALTIKETLHDIEIIELGSGDCSKISQLLDQVHPADMQSIHYLPVDVSLDALKWSATKLSDKYPGLSIHCIVADFMTQLQYVKKTKNRLFCFFGSTIGNLNIEERERFLKEIGQMMNSDDRFLVGFDLIKTIEIMERAYNDSSNTTACFNRNILTVVNSIIQTDFKVESFQHVAFFNENQSRIEMHLKALHDIDMACPYLPDSITINKGETIHTENSYKFTLKIIERLLEKSGLKTDVVFFDPMNWFALVQVSKK
jgi:L-histidine Nalpha-methyltransferase